MENASKALIMAASILIGIMILSLMVYLFTTFGATSAELHKQQATDRLNQFNSQFTSYEDKSGLTIYDVATVANLATENNKYYELPKVNTIPTKSTSDFYISVIISRPSETPKNISGGFRDTNYETNIQSEINTDLSKINQSSDKLSTYNCKAYISTITERVYRVDFTQQ